MDGTFMNDFSIFVQVNAASNINEFESNSLGNIYPNPSSDPVFIPIELPESGQLSLKIYDQFGKFIKEEIGNFNVGNQLILLDPDLPTGQYHISAHLNNMNLGVQQMMIVK